MAMGRLKAPQRREQLLAVAVKLFARWGYSATTTAAIAEAAGVTEPILYRHFRGKQELYIAAVSAAARTALEIWQSMIDGIDDPAGQLRTIASRFAGHVLEQGDHYHLLHGALATSRDRRVVAVLREFFTGAEQFFEGLFARGQARRVFRQDLDARNLAWQLIYAGTGFAMIVLNLGDDGRFVVQSAVDSLVAGFEG
jgi:AcrR family transcriptional regulator